MKFLPDKFVMMMIGAVLLALIIPEWGASDGPLRLGEITRYGIAVVFFLHGANLEPAKLAAGVRNWPVHLLIQSTTFVLFPLLGVLLYFATAGLLPDALRLGFFFLAALPSTISSSIALTGMGHGNIPVAVFNATLSSLLGMVLTPAMISVVTAAEMGEFSLIDAMIDIAITLLAPFAAGQIARPLLKTALAKHKSIVSKLDRGVILLIVFTSFATSTKSGIWSQFSLIQYIVTIALVLFLLLAAIGLTVFAARNLMKLSHEDEAASVFCGATKSLANGAPIAQILFAGSPQLGPIMLPLMLYHQIQLMVCAVIAQRYAKHVKADQTTES